MYADHGLLQCACMAVVWQLERRALCVTPDCMMAVAISTAIVSENNLEGRTWYDLLRQQNYQIYVCHGSRPMVIMPAADW